MCLTKYAPKPSRALSRWRFTCREVVANAANLAARYKWTQVGHERIQVRTASRGQCNLAADYDVAVARAQAAYSITNEECNDKDAMTRKVCERVAKAALDRAEAEALAAMKTASR